MSMDSLTRAKCALYLELLKMYDVENVVISESDIHLMDTLLRDKGVRAYIKSKMGV